MYRLFELFVYQFSGNPIFSNLFIFETDQSSYSFPIETQQFFFFRKVRNIESAKYIQLKPIIP